MADLSLRLRVFLFFALIACGFLAALGLGLVLGFRQLANPEAFSAFVTIAIIAGLGGAGVSLLIWLLFDENVSKPLEALAAQIRVSTEIGGKADVEASAARHLGDLAPAAKAMNSKLVTLQNAAAQAAAAQTMRLEAQRGQLLRILSDIPIAVILVRADHQIVLYDGQAADLMERERPARLGGSVFDYLDRNAIEDALANLQNSGGQHQQITVTGRSGTVFKGHMRLFGETDGYTLMLEPLAPDAERPLVYDFDLLDRPAGGVVGSAALEGRALRDLSYVVFDCETTGLDPVRDEVVQLGAVRVVNGKIVEGEKFDRLVNPGRPIPPAATRVHHIDNAMIASAAPFTEVSRAFHRFAENAVLIAHNAPFDMAFLRRSTEGSAFTFDNPILDTVHLSAVVFGGAQTHTLDALCARLGVEIPEHLRHTGLGDAMATARAFTALLPVLEQRGLDTYGALRREVQRYALILKVEE